MKTLKEVDQNFQIHAKIDKADVAFYNVLPVPFVIYGVF